MKELLSKLKRLFFFFFLLLIFILPAKTFKALFPRENCSACCGGECLKFIFIKPPSRPQQGGQNSRTQGKKGSRPRCSNKAKIKQRREKGEQFGYLVYVGSDK
jgi:hypothetical protein